METRQRRSFTDDYKRQAVDLVASSGRSIGSVAKELGLRDSVLRRWVRLLAHGTAHHPCGAHRCPVATHVACHRGLGRRLAPAGSAHRWPIRRDRSTGPSRPGMFAPDDGAWHRADHFERHGGRDRHWRRILQRPRLRRLARTGAQTKSRRETARSSAKSRGAAIATCAFCSCRRHDVQLELGRPLDREVGGLGAFEDFVDVCAARRCTSASEEPQTIGPRRCDPMIALGPFRTWARATAMSALPR